MSDLENAFIRKIAHKYYKILGFSTKEVLGQKISDHSVINGERQIDEKTASAFVGNISRAQALMGSVVPFACKVLAEYRDQLEDLIAETGDDLSLQHFSAILDRYAPESRKASAKVRHTATIGKNWLPTQASGPEVLRSGVYQVFRLYKPYNEGTDGKSRDDVVVTELVYVDSDAMEMVLVSCEGSVFWGTLHINKHDRLFALLQRPAGKAEHNTPVHMRFYAVNIKFPNTRKPPPYSGLYVKTGDYSRLPLSGDCVFLEVPADDIFFADSLKLKLAFK